MNAALDIDFIGLIFCSLGATDLPAASQGWNERGERLLFKLLSPSPKQTCHPDRSEAQWRDLLCAFAQTEL